MANPDTIERKWYVVDANGQTLGRLASEVAKVLRGKNKPEFTPHEDTGAPPAYAGQHGKYIYEFLHLKYMSDMKDIPKEYSIFLTVTLMMK